MNLDNNDYEKEEKLLMEQQYQLAFQDMFQEDIKDLKQNTKQNVTE